MTLSLLTPPTMPGTPVLGIAQPSVIILARSCPRIVSTTKSTSRPAVKPGPNPIVTGAISLVVPRFFFARIASIRAATFPCS